MTAIAVIPGDGIGPEVITSARAVLDAVAAKHGIELSYTEFDWSCQRYAREGAMMPADGIETLRGFDAILLGAVGWPGVPDHVSLWGLLIPIRRAFRQYVNLRPIKVFDGVESPLRAPGDVDFVVVRENVEGEYSEIGGRMNRGFPDEMAVQESVFTRVGVSRIADYAFELARDAAQVRHVGDEVERDRAHAAVLGRGGRGAGGAVSRCADGQEHIDALAAKFVLQPQRFDVVVGSNLFGDILSDLAAAVAGSIGIAPSANLDPTKEYPSMFEPVHGSAPDIAGQGIANPVGAVWSAAMMLEHLGHDEAAGEVLAAMESTLAKPETRTAIWAVRRRRPR